MPPKSGSTRGGASKRGHSTAPDLARSAAQAQASASHETDAPIAETEAEDDVPHDSASVASSASGIESVASAAQPPGAAAPAGVRIRRAIWGYKESTYPLLPVEYDVTVRTLQEEVLPKAALDSDTSSVLCLLAIRIPEATFSLALPETRDPREFEELLCRQMQALLNQTVFERLSAIKDTRFTQGTLTAAELINVYTLQLAGTLGIVEFDETPDGFFDMVADELLNEAGSGPLHSAVIVVDAARLYYQRALQLYPKANHDREPPKKVKASDASTDYKGKGKAKVTPSAAERKGKKRGRDGDDSNSEEDEWVMAAAEHDTGQSSASAQTKRNTRATAKEAKRTRIAEEDNEEGNQ